MKIGDIVVLKSDSQCMVVNNVVGGNVCCQWSLNSKIFTEDFPIECLKPFKVQRYSIRYEKDDVHFWLCGSGFTNEFHERVIFHSREDAKAFYDRYNFRYQVTIVEENHDA